jgi:hypothetical protein
MHAAFTDVSIWSGVRHQVVGRAIIDCDPPSFTAPVGRRIIETSLHIIDFVRMVGRGTVKWSGVRTLKMLSLLPLPRRRAWITRVIGRSIIEISIAITYYAHHVESGI